jgi:hypothetical protein
MRGRLGRSRLRRFRPTSVARPVARKMMTEGSGTTLSICMSPDAALVPVADCVNQQAPPLRRDLAPKVFQEGQGEWESPAEAPAGSHARQRLGIDAKACPGMLLGGRLITGHTWTSDTRPTGTPRNSSSTLESPPSARPSPSRSSIAVTAAVSPSSRPQSSTGRFEVTSVLARS